MDFRARDKASQELAWLSALEGLVTERGNPGNRRGLASVIVVVDAPVLARGVELVDTPGTGSVYAHNTAEAEAALDTMDAAVFALTADRRGGEQPQRPRGRLPRLRAFGPDGRAGPGAGIAGARHGDPHPGGCAGSAEFRVTGTGAPGFSLRKMRR